MDFNIRVAVVGTLLQSNECLCLFEMGSKVSTKWGAGKFTILE
jgi:hypothetical protein